MKPDQSTFSDRIFFLDNIRYLMVLLVVVLHAAASYSFYTTWWTVNDENSIFFDYIFRTLGVFLMPVLFFIAGYFVLPSLHKKGTWHFIKSKFKRLGIPWLIGVMLLGPVEVYIYNYSRRADVLDFWNIFLIKMNSFLSFRIRFSTSNTEFSHLHFWFISLLLLFFIVFALLHKSKSILIKNSQAFKTSKISSHRSILLILFLVSVLSTILTLIMHGVFSKGNEIEPWVIIGSLLQFQPTRIFLYILCFGLGIYAFHKNWFVVGNIPGHFVFWTALSIILWLGKEKALSILLENLFSPVLAAFFLFLQTLLLFSILLTLVSFGKKFWNSSSRINLSLAENSYHIYMVHLLFIYLAQLFLRDWLVLSIYIKFVIVGLSAIFLSYLSSQYVIRPFPRLSVTGMIGIFVLLLMNFSPA